VIFVIDKIGFSNIQQIQKLSAKCTVKSTEENNVFPSDSVRISGSPVLETPKDAVKTLASGFGYTEFPQISPDGKTLIFNVVGDYTTSQMLELNLDKGDICSLFTKEPLSPDNIGEFLKKNQGKTDEQGTWSNDGKTIFYRSNQKGTFGIGRYDVKKNKSQLIIHDQNMNMKHPEETKDGYIVGYGGVPGEKHKTSEKFSDIFIANPEDGSYRMITHSDGSVAYKHPSIMDEFVLAHKTLKDGEKELNSDLVKIDMHTGKEVKITDTPDIDERHAFYNEKIGLLTFHSDEGGDKNIWLSTPDGSKKCQLTFYGKTSQSPCWSPDGKKIYFVKKQDSIPDDQPFYERQSDIRVIKVEKALEDLIEQTEDRIKKLKKNDGDKELISKLKEQKDNYKYFCKFYEK
jgi:Tol biopolymer transport system component